MLTLYNVGGNLIKPTPPNLDRHVLVSWPIFFVNFLGFFQEFLEIIEKFKVIIYIYFSSFYFSKENFCHPKTSENL